MIFEGDRSVIEAVKEKKRLMDAGEEHGHLNILCIVDGGLMKGVYAVGAGLALEEQGYLGIFDTIVGISSGAPSAAYFLTGQIHEGASLIHEECCTKKFLNFWRFSNILDTKYIVNTIENSIKKKLDIDILLAKSFQLRIGMVNFETAACFLMEPQTKQELLDGIQASISMPGLVKEKIFIRGKRYLDGASSIPHAIQKSIETISATHVVVLTNQDKGTPDVPWLEKLINSTILRGRFSKSLLKAANNRRKTRHEYVNNIIHGEVGKPVCLIWGDGSIGSFERNPEKVKEVIEKSRLWWLDLLKD